MPFDFQKVEAIQVVLERRASNQLVGVLTRANGKFHFEYFNDYLRSPKAIALGPEMPLTRRSFQSDKLFRPFTDRIPSKENPAYSDYCKSAGISPNESDTFVLLSTIASRGPSSFLFKPVYHEVFSGKDLKAFRTSLGLSAREFALCFDFSQAGITRVETGKTDGREILKRTEIYARYPEVAMDQLRRRSAYLHKKKLNLARKWLVNFRD